MENTNKDEEIVEVNVTGVSMSGKAEIKNEHSGTPQEDQEKKLREQRSALAEDD